MITVRYAQERDFDFFRQIETGSDRETFLQKVKHQTGYLITEDETPVGILHYTLLWDKLPFLNLLFLLNEKRGMGAGKKAMEVWEADMKRLGYDMVLLSTQVDEEAQFFYRKLGYRDCGGLLLQEGSLKQPMELFMSKIIRA